MEDIIKSKWFIVLVLLFLLVPQVAHSLYVFNANSQYNQPWFAWCYAIGVDGAILVFTTNGWVRTGVVYFVGTLATNMVYLYFPEGIVSGVLIGVMLSGSILTVTHLFHAKIKESEAAKQIEPEPEKPDLLEELKKHDIAFEIQPHKCPECDTSFATAKQLNGHISGHKQTGDWHEEEYGDWELKNKNNERFLSNTLKILP